METDPQRSTLGYIENPATVDGIKRLSSTADVLASLGSETFQTESYRMSEYGGLVFDEQITIEDGKEIWRPTVSVVGPGYPDDVDVLVDITFSDDEVPEMYLETELMYTKNGQLDEKPRKSLEKARDICIRLFESGLLSELEGKLAMYAVGTIAEHLNEYINPNKLIELPDGGNVTVGKAIGRAITLRNPDLLQAHDYEMDTSVDHIRVTHQLTTNDRRFSDCPRLVISRLDFRSNSKSTMEIYPNGDVFGFDDTANPNDGHLTPHQFSALQHSIDNALKNEGLTSRPVEKWRLMLSELHDTLALYEEKPGGNEATIKRALSARDRLLYRFRKEFQSRYHLTENLNDLVKESPNLYKNKFVPPGLLQLDQEDVPSTRNKLLLDTRTFFLLTDVGNQKLEIDEGHFTILDYESLYISDISIDGRTTKQVCVVGLLATNKGYLRGLTPLNYCEVLNWAPVNN